MQPLNPSLFEETDQPVLVCDADGRVAACSAAAAKLLAKPVAEILGQPFWTLFGADHAGRPAPVAAGSTQSSLITLGDKPARVVFLNQQAQADASAVPLIGRQQYGSLFDASRDGIAFVGLDGRILDANPAFQHMLGYTLDELRTLRYQDFTPARWAEMEATVVREQVLARGHADDYEKEYVRRDGTILNVQIRAWLVRDADGKPYCMAGFARDVTASNRAEAERRKLESELLHARRMEAIGQLAGGVAHDFNNILTAILGSAELLRAQMDPRVTTDAARLLLLDQIQAAAQRAATLTRQMLSFSRRQARQREVLHLNQLVRELEPLLRRVIPESVEIALELTRADVRIEADPTQVEQALLNLCVNARDAMPEGGQLTVETTLVNLDEAHALTQPGARAGPHALLAVRDTGCGMSREVLEQIFEPFFTTKPAGQGTGLGLSSVQGIVDDLGGHILVSSEVGQGSRFALYIPAAVAEPARAAAASPVDDAALTGNETVLICEDDETVCEVCSRFLRNAGYNVMTAGSAEEALAVAAKSVTRIDLLLTDVIMPGMNGHRLAETLTASQPWLRTLFISGYAGGRTGGPSDADLIEKPFSRRLLLRRVRATLDARSTPGT